MRVYALVSRGEGQWQLHPTREGCGAPGGMWLDQTWADAEDAKIAADRYVVASFDVDVPLPEEQRRQAER